MAEDSVDKWYVIEFMRRRSGVMWWIIGDLFCRDGSFVVERVVMGDVARGRARQFTSSMLFTKLFMPGISRIVTKLSTSVN